ncbi:MAG: VOC family protein [Thermoactinospora sp.]|nr:VOC family protein [Thermoactinospora sp.]
MTSRLNPYITFANGDARQALEFYRGVFGGELILNTFGESGMPDSPEADKIMHGQLETPSGYTIMGADLPPGMEHTPGHSIVICLSGDDGVLREYFAALKEGGHVETELEKQMWGDEYGACTDRFGVQWMVNLSSS